MSHRFEKALLFTLAIAAPERMEEFPDVPTMKESGADVDAAIWSGVLAPRGTPPEIVRKLQDEFMRIARIPDVVERLRLLTINSIGSSSDEFSRMIAADLERWAEVARAGNIRMEQ